MVIKSCQYFCNSIEKTELAWAVDVFMEQGTKNFFLINVNWSVCEEDLDKVFND